MERGVVGATRRARTRNPWGRVRPRHRCHDVEFCKSIEQIRSLDVGSGPTELRRHRHGWREDPRCRGRFVDPVDQGRGLRRGDRRGAPRGPRPHPDGTEIEPRLWWAAYEQASAGLLDGVAAIGVGGQQQGMVCLDDAGEVLRPAILWNDTRSARAAVDLTDEFGGPKAWADAVGLVPVASFTVTKLRWFSRAEPELAARTSMVLLPHDWLTHRLRADRGEPTTDRGEASGTGYWSPAAGAYRQDLVRLAFGRDVALPRIAGPAEVVGETTSGALLSAGTGDTMGGALGVGLRPGDVVVSLGTSGCVYGLSDVPTADASGLVAGYADATGRFLPLVCTLNAARVLVTVADLLGRSLAELDELALSAQPGAGGLTLLPYLDGERTPICPTRAVCSPA